MRLALIIVAVTVAMVLLPVWLLAPPLFVPDTRTDGELLANWNFSDPGRAGMLTFSARCADCHGVRGQGTESGPSLLNRSYSADFREAPAFHNAVRAPIQAHQDFIRIVGGANETDFNDLELLGKFLREARRLDMAKR